VTEASAAQHSLGALARRRGVVVSERRLLLAGLDIIAVAGTFVVAFNLRTSEVRGSGFYVPRLGTLITIAGWLLCAQVAGAYDLRNTRRLPDIFRVVLTALAGSTVALLIVFFIVPYRITRPTLLFWVPLAGVAILSERLAYRRLFAGSQFATRIALVARPAVLEKVWPNVSPHVGGLYRVAAVIDPKHEDAGERLREAVAARGIELIVLGTRDEVSRELFGGVLRCHERGVAVRSLAALYEELTGRLLLDQLGHTWLMSVPMRNETSRLYATFKRGYDIAAASTALLAFAALFAPLALAIRIADRGPVFHRQRRVGKYGRVFTLAKLRTMRHDPEAQMDWTEPGDARITRVGAVLRRLHLDELPQAWSILRGDMSLIGPRPEQPRYVEELRQSLDFYSSRLTVRPGLTGWAQVNDGYCGGVDGARVKLSYDLYYIKHQSASLDLLIMARTLTALLSFRGR